MEGDVLHPIVYRLPRAVWGQDLIDAHIVCMENMDNGWEGSAEHDDECNTGKRLRGSHFAWVKFFIFPPIRWYDFVLASKEEIIPTDIYHKGQEIPFALSNSTGENIGLLRWVHDTKDELFQVLRPRWREYINALDAILSPATI